MCGRVRGYQFGHTDAFRSGPEAGIDNVYANGVSLTHGQIGSRTHIWTFVSGHSNFYDRSRDGPFRFCPCATADAANQVPPYVGNDYFCDSGINTEGERVQQILYTNPLWDGTNCAGGCCRYNNPPYFTKTLPAPISNNIELRVCCSYEAFWVDAPID